MPVLERLWGPDLRMQDSGLGVGVCPDEVPGSRVWTPSVACAGLSLALEIPTLIRQLRAAWRTRRGDPRGPERSEGSSWVEEEQEEVEKVKEIKQVTDDSNTHVEGKESMTIHNRVKLVEDTSNKFIMCLVKTYYVSASSSSDRTIIA